MDSVSDSKNSPNHQKKRSKPTSNQGANGASPTGAQYVAYQGMIQPKGFPGLPSSWTTESETIASHDGKQKRFTLTHHSQEWTNPKALVILHGLGEHGGRYLHAPHYLDGTVGAIFTVDHKGHGRSEGLQGHTERFDDFSDDAAAAIRHFYAKLKTRFEKPELHLLGHSMGGLIALRTLFLHPDLPIRSAAASAAAFQARIPIPKLKEFFGKAIGKVWGSLHLSNEINPALLSHDSEVGKAYTADRLVHQKITPSFFREIQKAMAETLKRETGFPVPLQMMVPMDDALVDPDRQIEFFKRLSLPGKDKELKTYPGFYHEIFNEVKKEEPFRDLRSWLDGRKLLPNNGQVNLRQ